MKEIPLGRKQKTEDGEQMAEDGSLPAGGGTEDGKPGNQDNRVQSTGRITAVTRQAGYQELSGLEN